MLSLFHFSQALPTFLSVLIYSNCQYGPLWAGVREVSALSPLLPSVKGSLLGGIRGITNLIDQKIPAWYNTLTYVQGVPKKRGNKETRP